MGKSLEGCGMAYINTYIAHFTVFADTLKCESLGTEQNGTAPYCGSK